MTVLSEQRSQNACVRRTYRHLGPRYGKIATEKRTWYDTYSRMYRFGWARHVMQMQMQQSV